MDNQTGEHVFTKKERRELRRQEKNSLRDSSTKKKQLKRATMWVLLAGVLAGSVFALYKYGNAPGSTTAMLVDVVSPSDHVSGVTESKIILVEYGDFQCPACGQYEPIVQKIRKDYTDKIAFVYRHFPLSQHKNAKITAYASEAAGKQGKFWEMHDMIYENQRAWSNLSSDKMKEVLMEYAKSVGLDLNLFSNDMDSGEVKAKVEADNNGGLKAGVNSTPTFILNGKKIQPRSYDEFKNFIEGELAANS